MGCSGKYRRGNHVLDCTLPYTKKYMSGNQVLDCTVLYWGVQKWQPGIGLYCTVLGRTGVATRYWTVMYCIGKYRRGNQVLGSTGVEAMCWSLLY